jgi:hypothetical protein
MASRAPAFGMDKEIQQKLLAKYDSSMEAEVLTWIKALTGAHIQPGPDNVHEALKSGEILLKLINAILDKTPVLPKEAANLRRPVKINSSTFPFKQMENIEQFLKCAEAYGTSRTYLFQTVDLYENRNMTQVINTLVSLGTECQRNGMNGPTCGAKPSNENRRNFTEDQLKSGNAVIGLQMGTNKGASQKGMSMGNTRHIADIRCDNISQEGQSVIGLQMGTNQGASQKGMTFGATRHIADIKVPEADPQSQNVTSLQYGTNKGANQSGIRFGAQRHITDTQCGGSSNKS